MGFQRNVDGIFSRYGTSHRGHHNFRSTGHHRFTGYNRKFVDDNAPDIENHLIGQRGKGINPVGEIPETQIDPALPGGVNGTLLSKGQSVMVDLGGNFNGYMCDMSRVFSVGKLTDEAYAAHQVCLDIQEEVANMAKPGVVCEDLYNKAIDMVTKAGFADNFMGIDQKAKFIGHGIGLEINEAPVLAPRVKQELEPGMVFALEPKIVLPGVGPVGIENSWAVTAEGVEKLTLCNEEIIEF